MSGGSARLIVSLRPPGSCRYTILAVLPYLSNTSSKAMTPPPTTSYPRARGSEQAAELADVRNGHTDPAGDEPGQMRDIGGDDQHGRRPVGRFRLRGRLYRGRGDHCVHGLLG